MRCYSEYYEAEAEADENGEEPEAKPVPSSYFGDLYVIDWGDAVSAVGTERDDAARALREDIANMTRFFAEILQNSTQKHLGLAKRARRKQAG